MSDHPTLTLFPPSEAARITGLSTLAQTDWRRRGHLPPLPDSKHARFDVFDLARMQAMRALSDRGIGPARSKAVAPSCALRIVGYALRWRNAWAGNPEAAPGATWRDKAEWLRAGVLSVSEHRFLMWGSIQAGEETHLFTNDPVAWFDGAGDRPRLLPGPVVVLDLEAMGGALLDIARVPLARVDLPA